MLRTARPVYRRSNEARPGPARVDTYSWPDATRPGQYITLNTQYNKGSDFNVTLFLQVPVTKQVVQHMWDKAKILCSMRVAQK